jgi:hypothetical protein
MTRQQIRTRQLDPWLAEVTRYLNRNRGARLTADQIVYLFGEPGDGVTAAKKLASATVHGSIDSDRSQSQCRYYGTGIPYGLSAAPPEWKCVAGLGYGPRVRWVFDLAGVQA